MGGSILSHITTMLIIFREYLFALVFPFYVRIIPPMYAPVPHYFIGWQFILSVCFFVAFMFFVYRTYRYDKRVCWFLSCFLISLIPVSNIIPIVTPMAYRFLYIPSVFFIGANIRNFD